MNWKLTLTYDGTDFHGWQVQPGLTTVQGTLAATLRTLVGEKVLPQASGRTDAGVHALGQVVSFALETNIPRENLHRALNQALPPSIRVITTEPVGDDFHARHAARQKTYEYRIFERRRDGEEQVCSPFLAPYVWNCRWPLVYLEAMSEAAKDIVGRHDFTSFGASDPDMATREDGDGVNPVKTIESSAFARERDLLVYRVTGSGFLHHMVRNLVGTFVDIGRGAMAADCVPKILAAKDRTAAGPTAPPSGLFLHSVRYL
jgi:tRNA pseudouridine38-40 synthase